MGSMEWLAPGETEIAGWTAAVPTLGGRGAKYGGRLFLTSRRLVWVPLRIEVVSVSSGVYTPIEAGGSWWELALDEVAYVEPDPDRRALLHIVDEGGSRTSFLIAAGRFGPVWSKKNQVARDDAVSRISGNVGSSRAG